MKVSEAIKDLQARVDGEFSIKGKDDCADMKLGIKALERHRDRDYHSYMVMHEKLPGED